MKNFLFPRVFHVIGWILFVPAVVFGLLIFINAFDLSDSFGIDLPCGAMETVMNDAVIIGIALGAVFIVCSKESHEDEMTSSIRLSALLNSLYAYVVILIATTICINGLDFFSIMALDMVLLPIIYVIIFRLEMRRYYKLTEDEE